MKHSIALTETWDDIQAKIDVDHQLAKRLQAREQEALSIEEKATLFQQLLEKRRKHLQLKDIREKKTITNKSSTEKENVFKYEGKEKRAGTELAQEITMKQKVEDDKEIEEIKKLMEIILDEEEVAIDAIPLALSLKVIHMLKSFDRKDLETLYKLVKAKYESTRPVKDLDLVLWNDLKTMFELHVEDKIYMLVEKKYPLTSSTLSMMLEKKLMIDYESKMAYQLLKSS
ncbi:hypothetical protein Tco_0039260 [Tanacetum coccineum]